MRLPAINKIPLAAVIIILAFLSRGLLLEYTDLIDPTEARYATVAEIMSSSDDWLTPRLPRPEGNIAYLGKPPLHFWLTAATYSLFDVDEWTSRLPSYLSALFILCIIYTFCKKYFTQQIAYLSILITFSSAMFFFLAGASVTDMSLCAFTTATLIYCYSAITDPPDNKKNFYISSLFCSLAFLTKGPVALALIGLPVFIFCSIKKDFGFFKKTPWLTCLLIFLLISSPWFILSEIKNPGFSKYFFWNENIARYLFKDYGDKYGSGHVEPYGMSWLMLVAAFCPWSLVLIYSLTKNGIKKSWLWISEDPARLYIFISSISPSLFFTFVRQLHAMYLLPAIPMISVFSAILLNSADTKKYSIIYKKYLLLPYFFAWLSLIIAGSLMEFSGTALCISLIYLLLGLGVQIQLKDYFNFNNALIKHCALIFISYIVCISSLSPYINTRRSAKELVEIVANKHLHDNTEPSISVINYNSYSHYWSGNTENNELTRDVNIKYYKAEDPDFFKSNYILVKADFALDKISGDSSFKLIGANREWKLYENFKSAT